MRRLLPLVFSFSSVVAATLSETSSSSPLNTTATNTWVILQAFDWAALSNRGALYTTINSQSSALQSAGFNAVWFPPPSISADKEGYLPGEWYKLESETNQINAINSIKGKGMSPIADVVVNHRTAAYVDSCTTKYTSFINPTMGNWAVTKDDENCGSKASTCGCGNYDTGDIVPYAPDLDHTNTQVQTLVKDYLNFLKTKGYAGWRFDLVKGYSASYVGSYVAASAPVFSVGEYFDSSVSLVTGWIQGTGSRSQAFDFPLRYTLQSAIRNNNYGGIGPYVPGVIGKDAAHAVTFIDNHDTARDDRFGSVDQIIMGYAYIFTHSGTPCVFWSDWNTASIQSAIKTFITMRRTALLSSTASIYVEKWQSGLYAATINGKVAMKLGTSSWSPSDTTYKLYTSGNNYAIWMK
jgi:alpha-amylase